MLGFSLISEMGPNLVVSEPSSFDFSIALLFQVCFYNYPGKQRRGNFSGQGRNK